MPLKAAGIKPGFRALKNEYKFRMEFTPGWTGVMNMDADHYLGEILPPDLPFVRFYTWDRPTVSYGYNQNPSRRIEFHLCQQDNIPVVRRPTGGRELLHGHDICYCMAWPVSHGNSAMEAKKIFAKINDVLITGLKRLGLEAQWNEFRNRPKTLDGPCFAQVDSGEITVLDRKLVASAQRVFDGCVIQQGSIPLRRPETDLLRYLRHTDNELLRRKMDEMSTCLNDHLNMPIPIGSLVENFKEAFEASFGSVAGPGKCLLDAIERNNYDSVLYN